MDDTILAEGGQPIIRNHVWIAEVARAVTCAPAVFVRGQSMSNQLLGETPFAYNRFTAAKFTKRYGLVTFGVMWGL